MRRGVRTAGRGQSRLDTAHTHANQQQYLTIR